MFLLISEVHRVTTYICRSYCLKSDSSLSNSFPTCLLKTGHKHTYTRLYVLYITDTYNLWISFSKSHYDKLTTVSFSSLNGLLLISQWKTFL